MDFSLSRDQEALRDLTAQIVGDVCTAEYLRHIAGTEPGTDATLWRTLADAGLVGIGLPESVGGGGQSWLETCIVLSELARASAPVPALATMAFAAPSLAASGSHDELVARVATGESVVAAAVHEPTGDPFSAAAATVDGGLHGTKICVLHGTIAEAFVVTAIDGLHLVWADAPGVSVETQTTSSDAPDALVTFRGSPSELLAGPEGTALLIQRGL
ncbi:MAG: acyl-CoA/acyl-ACP dehydrogenase, partial [Ilumatobacter sp.]|nr:acyl-CoA/acyl-ACP dehydrogenase [Ilumatobacter sp.]